MMEPSDNIRDSVTCFPAYSSHPSSDQPPPPLGLGITASEAEELSSLVNGKTPVTITE